MKSQNKDTGYIEQSVRPFPTRGRSSHDRIVATSNAGRCLDAVQLSRLEESFRDWAKDSTRLDVGLSRNRILLIFLLIRYTGARLNEVLSLNPFRDIDFNRQSVVFGKSDAKMDRPYREVQIPQTLSVEIQTAINEPAFKEFLKTFFNVDPGHVRRKFYERAAACGFPKKLGAPDVIRKSRAVELIQNNMPLPVVQKILGHSTPNLAASYVEFSDDDIQQVAKFHLEKETSRKTSARNTFFGKIHAIQQGDIQAKVELVTIAGELVTTVITNDSLERLGLKAGLLISAEIKAPWVILQRSDTDPECSAENRFRGTVERIIKGEINTEYVVRLLDGTQLCSVVTTESSRRLGFKENDPVRAIFNCFAVVLHLE